MLSRSHERNSPEVEVLRNRAVISAGLTVGILFACALPVHADVPLPKLSLTVYGGPAMIDDTYGVEGFALAGGFRAAFIFSQRFGLEGQYIAASVEGKRIFAAKKAGMTTLIE